MKRLGFLTGFVILALSSGCGSSTQVKQKALNGSSGSLCQIADDFVSYLGTDVLITARYVSDGMHEEVLEEPRCGAGRRIIDIGLRGDNPSVKNFYSERRKLCDSRGAIHLCNVEAEVEFSGTVNIMSGTYVLDIKEVKSFRFLD